ncbi:hypothetical protein V8C37DRAFT_402062 [Trichoderma ceciliae]
MRVTMLFILQCIRLGFPALFNVYQFLKGLFQPCGGDRNKKNKGDKTVRFVEPRSHIRIVYQAFSGFF